MTTQTRAARLDEHGNPHSGSSDAIARYDEAVGLLLRLDDKVGDHADILVDEHPRDAMARAFAAYLHLASTDHADAVAARRHIDVVRQEASTDRELAHLDALEHWASGDWHGAASALDDLLVRWPADAVALALGHQLDFFTGDAKNLRDRAGRSLSAFDPSHPSYGYVRGMQAFGLEESGHYIQAEEAGLEATERNPDDVWAVHAVAHVYEMQGRVDEGIRFMSTRLDDWAAGNVLAVHNWWHYALYLLEAGEHSRILEIYDARIHHEHADMVSMQMLDASAILWRLHLDGVDTGDRAGRLADDWLAHQIGQRSWYAFNDAHAVMALVAAGRTGEAEEIVARLTRYADEVGQEATSNQRMSAEVAIPVCRALIAFGQGRFDDAITSLWPTRRRLHSFGGSHAQRDVFERTLVDAAVRAGRTDLADRLLSERLALRPSSVYAHRRRATLARQIGQSGVADSAQHAADRAQTLFRDA